MSHIPTELKYASSHEWVRSEDDGTVTVGISDHAQNALGDVVFVDLPELSVTLVAGDEAAVVESVKAASDIYAPIGGEVIAVNEELRDNPETINTDCYIDGWIFKLQPTEPEELAALLDAKAYSARCVEVEAEANSRKR